MSRMLLAPSKRIIAEASDNRTSKSGIAFAINVATEDGIQRFG